MQLIALEGSCLIFLEVDFSLMNLIEFCQEALRKAQESTNISALNIALEEADFCRRHDAVFFVVNKSGVK